jgi:hypothetical protein
MRTSPSVRVNCFSFYFVQYNSALQLLSSNVVLCLRRQLEPRQCATTRGYELERPLPYRLYSPLRWCVPRGLWSRLKREAHSTLCKLHHRSHHHTYQRSYSKEGRINQANYS